MKSNGWCPFDSIGMLSEFTGLLMVHFWTQGGLRKTYQSTRKQTIYKLTLRRVWQCVGSFGIACFRVHVEKIVCREGALVSSHFGIQFDKTSGFSGYTEAQNFYVFGLCSSFYGFFLSE